MPENKTITKTQRILSIYHLFTNCEEVTMQELDSVLTASHKTISRDIALLKSAGVKICYSSQRKAFILPDCERGIPDFPEGKSNTRFLEKIIRLITMMDEVPEKDCDIWYVETFPWISRRTMLRDFAVLSSIGYNIYYDYDFDMDYEGDTPPKRYLFSEPEGTYSLYTFKYLD